VWFGETPAFRKNIEAQFLGLKHMLWKKPVEAGGKLKMEGRFSSEK
jgi:hypothetical protein